MDARPASFPTPWAARAFAIVSALSQVNWLDLKEFQKELIKSISNHEKLGGCIADETSYYDCWVAALTAALESEGIPLSRIRALEDGLRAKLAAMTHEHDDEHDHHPKPIYTEQAL